MGEGGFKNPEKLPTSFMDGPKGRTTFLSGFSQMGKLLPISYTELRFNPGLARNSREKKGKKGRPVRTMIVVF